jgi:uncharacterized membrane protein YeaQ/YmgE (transglycosylase-associated protein family)
MINFIIWIIVGAVIGWVASLIMKTNKRQGIIADIVVGIVGAFVGGLILSPMFHISTINESNFSLGACWYPGVPSSCWRSSRYSAVLPGSC